MFEEEATRLALEIDAVNKAEGLTLDSVSRDIMLRKLYETTYGIHNHYAPGQSPLALSAARQKEEVYLYSKKAEDYRRFMDLGMAALTGLSLTEFFDLPAPDIEFLFAEAEIQNKLEGASAAKLEAKLKAALDAEKND